MKIFRWWKKVEKIKVCRNKNHVKNDVGVWNEKLWIESLINF